MIDQYKKNECNGCQMCKEICPKQAIYYKTDQEGFWYPSVDYVKCVKCGLCVKKCPNKTPIIERTKKPKVFAAWSMSKSVRLKSTSGGIFYELASHVLENGGYVAGCVYDDDFKGAHHILINSKKNLPPLMVSKYVESNACGIYPKVKDALSTGKPVLFVGAPCQVAALVSYLDKEYENLILCDFLCRGSNSPKAHRRYIEYLENKYGGKMVFLRSKDKRKGWNNFGQSAIFDNGKEYYANRNEDVRIIAYHYGNLMMRDSCHYCKFKKIPRVGADITLADFWRINPDDVDDIDSGVSLVMINTDKGNKWVDKIKDTTVFVEKDIEQALKGNSAIYKSAKRGKNRDKFLSELDCLPFDELVEKYKDKKSGVLKRAINKARNIAKMLISGARNA